LYRMYVLRRLAGSLIVLVGVTLVIFLFLRVLPGDPAFAILSVSGGDQGAIDPVRLEQLRKELGYDRPFHVQYYHWIKKMMRGDLGKSVVWNTPVSQEIKKRLAITIQLAVLSLILTVAVGLVIGTLAAVSQGSYLDYTIRLLAIGGMALPTFLSATLLILVLVLVFNWFPPIGHYVLWKNPWAASQQLIWPVLALGLLFVATLSRLVRNTMLEVLREDYIRTARSKGLSERIVLTRHALRNVFAPNLTMVALLGISMLGGSIIVETIFNLGGLGQGLVLALRGRDFPYIQAVVLLYAVLAVTINLVTDLLYGVVDPRIRLS
jgi:peptide/nickel transport system permease protein